MTPMVLCEPAEYQTGQSSQDCAEKHRSPLPGGAMEQWHWIYLARQRCSAIAVRLSA